MSQLDGAFDGLTTAVAELPGFKRLSFTVGELRADSDWRWGFDHGVYTFMVGGTVVYVGRALGCTLGERLCDQLGSTTDPEWANVVLDDATRVDVYAIEEESAFLAAALEAYLIEKLKPRFNKRLS